MPKLTISINGQEYTKTQQILMWDGIRRLNKCPECGAYITILYAPRPLFWQNIKCSSCNTVFWISPFRAFGAYPIRRDKPKPIPNNQVPQQIVHSKNNKGA